MRLILTSTDFLSLDHQRAKAKRPLVLLASLYRAAGVDLATIRDRGVRDVEDLGEHLFEAKPPTGYPDVSAYWAGPGALLARFEYVEDYATHAATRGIVWDADDTSSPELMVNTLAWKLLAGPVTKPSYDAAVAFVKALPARTSAAKKLNQAASLVLAMPEFFLH
jgi:hypothetical protein